MPNIINDRNQVSLREWWNATELNACRAQLNTALTTTLHLVKQHVQDPCDHLTPYEQRLALGLMPPNHHHHTMTLVHAHLRGERDTPTRPHSPILTPPVLFASMLHTWTTESLLSFAGRKPFAAEFDLDAHAQQISALLSEEGYGQNYTAPKLSDEELNRRRTFAFNVSCMGQWPENADLVTCRDGIVRGLVEAFGAALVAIPEAVEEQIFTRQGMSEVFSFLEPICRNAPLHIYRASRGTWSEHVMRLLKSWWSEARDALVYNTDPGFPFSRELRAGNIVRASVQLRYDTDEDPTEGQISAWVSLKEDHLYTYWCLMGDLQKAKRFGTGVFYARHDVPLDEQRLATTVAPLRLNSNWCTIGPYQAPSPYGPRGPNAPREYGPMSMLDCKGGHGVDRCSIM